MKIKIITHKLQKKIKIYENILDEILQEIISGLFNWDS